MALPRKYQIIPGQAGFYHCVSRCVRRAWLCGQDPLTGQNYDHRRAWMVDRLKVLTTCFAIDIYAYSIMSNHIHIVLYVDPQRVETLTDEEVVQRYLAIWRWRRPGETVNFNRTVDVDEIKRWRQRLSDVSWFMKALKEPIARIANAEDNCKGAFWEGRFDSIPLLDEQAVVTCLMYVDLNPIKAGFCETLEASNYTSIQQRILSANDKPDQVGSLECERAPLAPVMGETDVERLAPVEISKNSYVDLIRQTARGVLRDQKELQHAELNRLALSPKGWMTMATEFLRYFRSAAGGNAAFEAFMEYTGRQRRQDQSARKTLFAN